MTGFKVIMAREPQPLFSLFNTCAIHGEFDISKATVGAPMNGRKKMDYTVVSVDYIIFAIQICDKYMPIKKYLRVLLTSCYRFYKHGFGSYWFIREFNVDINIKSSTKMDISAYQTTLLILSLILFIWTAGIMAYGLYRYRNNLTSELFNIKTLLVIGIVQMVVTITMFGFAVGSTVDGRPGKDLGVIR